MADTIIKVMDGSREAGVYNISLASEPKQRDKLNTANNSLDTFYQTISKVFGPLAALYYKAFNYNKYLAGTGFAAFITLGLFFLMVALINLGDNSLPEDN